MMTNKQKSDATAERETGIFQFSRGKRPERNNGSEFKLLGKNAWQRACVLCAVGLKP